MFGSIRGRQLHEGISGFRGLFFSDDRHLFNFAPTWDMSRLKVQPKVTKTSRLLKRL